MKKTITCIVLVLSVSLAYAEINENNDDLFNHKQIAAPSWISAGLQLTSYILSFTVVPNIDNSTVADILYYGMPATAHIPLYFYNPLNAVGLGIGHAGIISSEILLDRNDEDYFRTYFGMANNQLSMYSVYSVYRDARVKAQSGIYDDSWRQDTIGHYIAGYLPANHYDDFNEEWKPEKFMDLLLAPVKKQNFRDPFVWGFGALGIISGLINGFVNYDNATAIWETGTSYIGPHEVPIYFSIPLILSIYYLESTLVAVSEESMYRGFLYEEMGSRYGALNANIIDSLSFAAVHIPGEIANDVGAGNVLLNFARRSLLTVYLNISYDRGGLQRSVGTHAMIDFSLLFMNWLFSAGAPHERFTDLLMEIPLVQFDYSIPF